MMDVLCRLTLFIALSVSLSLCKESAEDVSFTSCYNSIMKYFLKSFDVHTQKLTLFFVLIVYWIILLKITLLIILFFYFCFCCSFPGRYKDSDDLFFACEFRDKVSLLKDSDNK